MVQMLSENLVAVVTVHKYITPNYQWRKNSSLGKNVFLQLTKFFFGQCRNLGLKFGVDDKFKFVFLHRGHLLS